MAAKKSSKKASKRASKKATKTVVKKAKKFSDASLAENVSEHSCGNKSCKSGVGGCIYFLGFVGAAIFYISIATGFWNGVLGVLKALAWPAILVFKLLVMLA